MGLDKLIMSLLGGAAKVLNKVDTKLDILLKEFEKGCPPKNKLTVIIQQRKALNGGLSQAQKKLKNLIKTDKIITGIVQGATITTAVLTSIPAPTSFPPGTGITIGLIIKIASTLDTLHDLIKAGKGLSEQTKAIIKIIKDLLAKVQLKFIKLDEEIAKCLDKADLTPEEKAALSSELSVPQESSSPEENANNAKQLEDSLAPNSTTPYFYGEWRFIIDKDILNKHSYPRRRIIAIKGDQKLFGEFSFSSSTDILIDEMKFRIDNGGQTPLYYIGETIIE